MTFILALAKAIGAPGSLGLLAVSLGAGLALVYFLPQRRRVGQLWLTVVCSFYIVLALPLTATAISGRLPRAQAGASDDRLRDTQILHVFDGDNRRGRVREALRIYALASPELVIVSGEPWLFDALREDGIPERCLRLVSSGSNTRDQVAGVRELTERQPSPVVTIVASRLQMPRVAALVDAAGLNVILAPSPIDREPTGRGLRAIVPTYLALRISRDALYELAALHYYEREHWIRPSTASARTEPRGDE